LFLLLFSLNLQGKHCPSSSRITIFKLATFFFLFFFFFFFFSLFSLLSFVGALSCYWSSFEIKTIKISFSLRLNQLKDKTYILLVEFDAVLYNVHIVVVYLTQQSGSHKFWELKVVLMFWDRVGSNLYFVVIFVTEYIDLMPTDLQLQNLRVKYNQVLSVPISLSYSDIGTRCFLMAMDSFILTFSLPKPFSLWGLINSFLDNRVRSFEGKPSYSL